MFLHKSSILILTILVAVTFASESDSDSCEHKCPTSCCLKYSIKKVISELWSIPKNVSANINEFRCAVKSLLPCANGTLLGYLSGVSLTAIDYLTEMPTSLDYTCVIGTLLNQTLISHFSNDCCAKEGLKKAAQNFGEVLYAGGRNTIYLGMKLAGCPIKIPPTNVTKNACLVGVTPEILLQYDSNYEINEKLKPIVMKLIKSSNPLDRGVGGIAFNLGAKSETEKFTKIISKDFFRKAMQLKACKEKIPKYCCEERLALLTCLEKQTSDFAKNNL